MWDQADLTGHCRLKGPVGTVHMDRRSDQDHVPTMQSLKNRCALMGVAIGGLTPSFKDHLAWINAERQIKWRDEISQLGARMHAGDHQSFDRLLFEQRNPLAHPPGSARENNATVGNRVLSPRGDRGRQNKMGLSKREKPKESDRDQNQSKKAFSL